MDTGHGFREADIGSLARARAWIRAAIGIILLSAVSPSWSAQSTLETDTITASEGYIVLSWNLPEGEDLVLQRSRSDQFQDPITRSIPPSGDVTITGLENGRYYFRAGSPSSGWSDTVEIQVRHHSLGRALSFFTFGLGLFLVLIATIVTGHRATRRRQ